jgi:hypothetical protein
MAGSSIEGWHVEWRVEEEARSRDPGSWVDRSYMEWRLTAYVFVYSSVLCMCVCSAAAWSEAMGEID